MNSLVSFETLSFSSCSLNERAMKYTQQVAYILDSIFSHPFKFSLYFEANAAKKPQKPNTQWISNRPSMRIDLFSFVPLWLAFSLFSAQLRVAHADFTLRWRCLSLPTHAHFFSSFSRITCMSSAFFIFFVVVVAAVDVSFQCDSIRIIKWKSLENRFPTFPIRFSIVVFIGSDVQSLESRQNVKRTGGEKKKLGEKFLHLNWKYSNAKWYYLNWFLVEEIIGRRVVECWSLGKSIIEPNK